LEQPLLGDRLQLIEPLLRRSILRWGLLEDHAMPQQGMIDPVPASSVDTAMEDRTIVPRRVLRNSDEFFRHKSRAPEGGNPTLGGQFLDVSLVDEERMRQEPQLTLKVGMPRA
jgi:hypothetical protein